MVKKIEATEALILRDNARQQLEQIRTIDSGLTYLNKVQAMQTWAKAEKMDAELQNTIAEQKIRTQRKLGELLKEGQERGEVASQSKNPGGNFGIKELNTKKDIKTLSEIGLTPHQSMNFKMMASIDEDEFETVIHEKQQKVKEAVSELTTAGVLAYIRKKQNEDRRSDMRESHDNIELTANKKYRVIYADPPWMYDKGKELSDKYGDVLKHYPAMETEDICLLPVSELCENNCVLFMWATAPKLPEALQVIEAWGFQYKTNIVWDKVKHNFGFYFSVRHELLLIAGRGSSTPDSKKLHDSVISIERSSKHSEKPEYFRQLIDSMYTAGNKIELFARKPTDGWYVWGNEI